MCKKKTNKHVFCGKRDDLLSGRRLSEEVDATGDCVSGLMQLVSSARELGTASLAPSTTKVQPLTSCEATTRYIRFLL